MGGNSATFADPNEILSSLNLVSGKVFLDVGCGRGSYALAAAPIVNPDGKIYAIDLWDEGINELNSKAQELGYDNITAFIGNASENIPIPDHEVDLVFMGVVFHDMVEAGINAAVLAEITRVIKSNGTLAILEWKKDAVIPPGPPREIRLDSRQLDDLIIHSGFRSQNSQDWNEYLYLT